MRQALRNNPFLFFNKVAKISKIKYQCYILILLKMKLFSKYLLLSFIQRTDKRGIEGTWFNSRISSITIHKAGIHILRLQISSQFQLLLFVIIYPYCRQNGFDHSNTHTSFLKNYFNFIINFGNSQTFSCQTFQMVKHMALLLLV